MPKPTGVNSVRNLADEAENQTEQCRLIIRSGPEDRAPAWMGPPDLDRNGTHVYWAGTDGVIDDMWLEVDFENDGVLDVRYVPD